MPKINEFSGFDGNHLKSRDEVNLALKILQSMYLHLSESFQLVAEFNDDCLRSCLIVIGNSCKIRQLGETEASSAGTQLARDSRAEASK